MSRPRCLLLSGQRLSGVVEVLGLFRKGYLALQNANSVHIGFTQIGHIGFTQIVTIGAIGTLSS